MVSSRLSSLVPFSLFLPLYACLPTSHTSCSFLQHAGPCPGDEDGPGAETSWIRKRTYSRQGTTVKLYTWTPSSPVPGKALEERSGEAVLWGRERLRLRGGDSLRRPDVKWAGGPRPGWEETIWDESGQQPGIKGTTLRKQQRVKVSSLANAQGSAHPPAGINCGTSMPGCYQGERQQLQVSCRWRVIRPLERHHDLSTPGTRKN